VIQKTTKIKQKKKSVSQTLQKTKKIQFLLQLKKFKNEIEILIIILKKCRIGELGKRKPVVLEGQVSFF